MSSGGHRKQRVAGRKKGRSVPLLTEAPAALSGLARTFGYARVSTEEQNLDVQISALTAAGVGREDLLVEKISAVNAKRPMFNLLMKLLERGDAVLFHSLSRIGRSVPQIHETLAAWTVAGVTWRSLTEPHLDNSTASGRLMLNITSAMAQFERDQIVDRTRRGMEECRRKGMFLGRRKLFDAKQTASIKRDRKTMTREDVAKKWRCSAGTIDKYSN